MTENNTYVLLSVNTHAFKYLRPRHLNGLMTFGQRLRAARVHAGLTQEQLGGLAECGQAVVSKIERGDQEHSVYTPILARVCGISVDWLYDGTGQMLPGKRIDQYPEAVRHILNVTESLPPEEQYRAARLIDALKDH